MKEIKIIIDKNGQVTIDVEGVKGSSCKKLTKDLENAFGTTTEDKKKPDFYDTIDEQVSDEQGVGDY